MAKDRANDQGPVEFGSDAASVTELIGSVLPRTVNSLNDQLTQLTQGISYLKPASDLQAQAVLANTQALNQNTNSHGMSSVVGTLGGIASTLTSGLLSVSPILSGIASLFGGGGPTTPPPLTPFYMPPANNFQAANAPGGAAAGSQLAGADFGQAGQPRAMVQTSGPQITVHVQAMDSRSFIDHSTEIAHAVRDAMLNMHAINDVITNL